MAPTCQVEGFLSLHGTFEGFNVKQKCGVYRTQKNQTHMNRIFCPSRLWVECLSSTDPATVAKDDKKGQTLSYKCGIRKGGCFQSIPSEAASLTNRFNHISGGGAKKPFSKNQVHPGNEQLEPQSHLLENENHLNQTFIFWVPGFPRP